MRSLIAVLGLILLPGCAKKPEPPPPVLVTRVDFYDEGKKNRVEGIYPGTEHWRWTSRSFSALLDPPSLDHAVYLQLDFTFPIELGGEYPQVTIIARANGMEVGRRTYDKLGRHMFSAYVPLSAMATRPVKAEFELDRSVRNPRDGRVTGVIAISAELIEYEQTAEYREKEFRNAQESFRRLYEQKKVSLPLEKYRDFAKLLYTQPVWENLRFLNVRIIKNPMDLWMMQQIIFEIEPDFIVETGTWYGGSALFWAYQLNALNLKASRVLTVDIDDRTQHAATHHLWKSYVEFSQGSSTDPQIVARIAGRVKGHRTIVALDSDHSMAHVLEELRLYAPMVSPGSYMVVEDTHFDSIPTHSEAGPGPLAAIKKFLDEGGSRDFELDLSREPFLFSFNSGGWLRRR